MLQNTDYDATGGPEKCLRRIPNNLGSQPTFSCNPRSGSICSQLGKSLGALRCRKRLRRNTPGHGKRRTREKEIGLRSPVGWLSNFPEALRPTRIAGANRISSQVYQCPAHRGCPLDLWAAVLRSHGVEQRNQFLARCRELDVISNHDLLRGERFVVKALIGVFVRFQRC